MSRKRKSRKLEVQAAVKASPSAPRWVGWLAPLLVALFTLAAFLPTLQNQFVNWVDHENFLENPHYRGLGWSQLRWMWTTQEVRASGSPLPPLIGRAFNRIARRAGSSHDFRC